MIIIIIINDHLKDWLLPCHKLQTPSNTTVLIEDDDRDHNSYGHNDHDNHDGHDEQDHDNYLINPPAESYKHQW